MGEREDTHVHIYRWRERERDRERGREGEREDMYARAHVYNQVTQEIINLLLWQHQLSSLEDVPFMT
jgi:hypothetical protein